MDVPAPGVGAVCGGCPPGYTGDEGKCYGKKNSSADICITVNNIFVFLLISFLCI